MVLIYLETYYPSYMATTNNISVSLDFDSFLIHHSASQCPLNNSAQSSLLVNTIDDCSHVSVLLGHHAHAGKVCQCLRFSIQTVGQDQEWTLKFIKERFKSEGMSVAEKGGDEMKNTWALAWHAQTTSPGPKQGHCRVTWPGLAGGMYAHTDRSTCLAKDLK